MAGLGLSPFAVMHKMLNKLFLIRKLSTEKMIEFLRFMCRD